MSTIRGNGYFNGVYLAMDTMTFAGNETVTKGPTKLVFLFLLSFYYLLMHSFILVFVCYFQQTCSEIVDFVTGHENKSTCFKQDSHFSPGHDYKDKLLASFDSPGSITPPNEAENDICFPQLWSLRYDFEPEMLSEPLMVGQTERRDSRFSEIFNAQRDLFEPIIEGAENQDEDFSDTSSYKSTNDYFITEEVNAKLKNYMKDIDKIEITEIKEINDELSSGESTPTGSNFSLPSSFSNISMNDCENEAN